MATGRPGGEIVSGEIFLSASVPVAGRGDFYKTADPFLIQLAVRELVILMMRSGKKLVWGGHPAITPMVWAVCEDLNVEYAKSVVLYQTRFFEDQFPEENARFSNVIYVDARGSREESLTLMRRAMIERPNIEAAVFIGGMEGLFEESTLFVELHPGKPAIPVMATGGASLELAGQLRATEPIFASVDFVDLYVEQLGLGYQ